MADGYAMSPRPLLGLALTAVVLAQLSCASADVTPPSMPAERLGLPPEYRIFYDSLHGYGDWVLIQPMGYVFRPDVNFITWRPYEDGYWAPSDLYGWTWISAEPFGWATYHYGQWSYDRYYGWVWAPGPDWGPAWVAWEVTDDYAGWSPLLSPPPPGIDINGGLWSYVPLGMLGNTGLPSHIVHDRDLGSRVQSGRPIVNLVERGGVLINRGPSFEMIEHYSGTLPRVKIEPQTPAPASSPGTSGTTASKSPKGAQKAPANPAVESTRRAAEDAARAVRGQVQNGGAPPQSLAMLRAPAKPASAKVGHTNPWQKHLQASGMHIAADSTAH
jgi:hypothetical protein